MNRLGLRIITPLFRTAVQGQARRFASSPQRWSKVISETPTTVSKNPILVTPPPLASDVTTVPTSRLRSVIAAQARLRSRERQTSRHLLSALRDLRAVKHRLHTSTTHTHRAHNHIRNLKTSFDHEVHLRTELEKQVHMLEEKIAHERSWRRIKEWSWRGVIVGGLVVSQVCEMNGAGLELKERLKKLAEWITWI